MEGQNPEMGNSQDDVSAENKPAESITDVMNAMNGDPKPDEKPGDNGDKSDGKPETVQNQDNPKWMAQLDGEALKDADFIKQLRKFQNIGDLARSYSNLEKKMGSYVNIPSEESGEEELNAFYQKLGKPESADGYSIKDEKAGPFKELAFKTNLTDKQATVMFEGLAQIGKDAAKAMNDDLAKMAQESEKALKEEWGNDYNKNLEFLKRGIAAYGGKSLGQKLTASGLIYDADIVKMFASLGKMNSESTATSKGAGGRTEYQSTANGGHFDFGI